MEVLLQLQAYLCDYSLQSVPSSESCVYLQQRLVPEQAIKLDRKLSSRTEFSQYVMLQGNTA